MPETIVLGLAEVKNVQLKYVRGWICSI